MNLLVLKGKHGSLAQYHCRAKRPFSLLLMNIRLKLHLETCANRAHKIPGAWGLSSLHVQESLSTAEHQTAPHLSAVCVLSLRSWRPPL